MAISDRLTKLTTDITNAYTSIENKLPKILPEEYQQVEYIESTGTQYIDTNVTNSATWEMQMKMEWTSFLHGGSGFAYASNGINNNMQIASTKEGNWTANGSSSENPITLNQIYNVSISQSTKKLLVNGIEMASRSYIQVDEKKIYLFGCSTGSGSSGYCYEKVYSAKIYDNNILIRDYIPCYRKSDNEIGLYDLVNNVFYTNAGTGTFLKGYDSVIGMAKNTENLSTAIDSIEVIEEATAEGDNLTLSNTKAMPIKDIQINGKTEQDGEPTPDTPVEIKNVEGKNLANINNISDDSIIKIKNDTIELSNNFNTSGYKNTRITLSQLCPNLKIGEEYTLSFNTTNNYNYIYLNSSAVTWSNNNSKIITQEMLSSFVAVYGGYNETTIISEFMISREGGKYLPYNSIEFKVQNENLIGLGTKLNGYVDVSSMKMISSSSTGSSLNSVGYYFNTSQLPNTITFKSIGANRANVCYFNELPANNATCLLRKESNSNPRTITVDKSYKYVHIQFSYNNLNVTNIMVNEGNVDLDYIESQTQTALFTFEEGQYLAEGGYLADDGIHNIWGKIDLSTLNFIPVNSNEASRTQGLFGLEYSVPNMFKYNYTDIPVILSNKYIAKRSLEYLSPGRNPDDKTIATYNGIIYIQDSNFSGYTNEQVKNALQGTILQYPLIQESIITYNATQQAQWNAFFKTKTYDDITYITTDGDLAPIIKVDYYKKI